MGIMLWGNMFIGSMFKGIYKNGIMYEHVRQRHNLIDIDKEWNYHHPRTFLISFPIWKLDLTSL